MAEIPWAASREPACFGARSVLQQTLLPAHCSLRACLENSGLGVHCLSPAPEIPLFQRKSSLSYEGLAALSDASLDQFEAPAKGRDANALHLAGLLCSPEESQSRLQSKGSQKLDSSFL